MGHQAGPLSQLDSKALYSGAQSFLSYLEKGVDPRTGTYTVRVALPTIAMNTLSGPDLDVSLGFDALRNVDAGLGRGWAWGFTQLDPDSKRLHLAGGETHLAIATVNAIDFPDRKLLTFIARKHGNTVEILHKSGRREILSMFDEADPMSPFMTTEIVSPQGRSVHLTWRNFEGQPALESIRDQDAEVLRVERNAFAASITLAGPGRAAAVFRLVLAGDLVSAIELPVPEKAAWRFTYEHVADAGIALISRVESPTGSVETVAYGDGHRLPARPGTPGGGRMPYVVRYAMDPGGGQTPRVTTYTYSTKNFLGYEAGVDWEDATDALYKLRTAYTYSSTEYQLDENETARVTIERSFNRFHLQTRELRSEGDCQVETINEYHDVDGKAFDEQPATVQLPKRVTRRWRRGALSFDETTTYTYDAYGNLASKTTPDGIVTRQTWYDTAGEPGCPADPYWAEPRTMKSEEVVPSTAQGVEPGAQAKLARYQYALLPSLAAGAPGFLVRTQTSLSSGGVEYKQVTNEFVNATSSPLLHGREQRRVETIGGYRTIAEIEYSREDNTLVTRATMSSDVDDVTTTSVTHMSVATGLMTRSESSDDIVTREYDVLGRVTLQTTTPKSGDNRYRVSLRTAYFMAAAVGERLRQVVTNEFDVVDTTDFEGTGQTVRVTHAEPDVDAGAHREVQRMTYDARGRLAQASVIDWHEGVPNEVVSRFRYDNWSNVSETVRPDGAIEHVEHDPVLRKETRWTSATGASSHVEVRTFNGFDKPVANERFDPEGRLISRHTWTYDGLGRVASITDPNLKTSICEYDVAGRLSRVELSNKDVIQRDYAPHSEADNVTCIRVNDVVVGQRHFDGLLRVSEQTVGGRKTTFAYDGDRSTPTESRNAAGELLQCDVNPSLPEQMMIRRSGALTTHFDYDPVSGQLLRAEHAGGDATPSIYTCTRYASARPKEETWSDATGARSCQHIWSLLGEPVAYTDVTGKEHRRRYEAGTGRLSQVSVGDVTIDYTYDALGRMDTQSIRQAGTLRLTTTLGYDAAGREITRDYEAPGHPSISLKCGYDKLDLLLTRERWEGGVLKLYELFSYDARDRLELYGATGEADAAPADPFAPSLHIAYQQWEYDALDNIVQITTNHQSGGRGIVTYRYDNAADPTQLTTIQRTGYGSADGTQTLQYDDAGRMIAGIDGVGTTYNGLGQPTGVTRDGVTLASYAYNGIDEQDRVTVSGERRVRVFRESRLVTELRGAASRVYLEGGAGALEGTGALQVYAVDRKASVVTKYGAGNDVVPVTYAPTGYRGDAASLDGVPGQDGEMVDPVTGDLWLGNQRMYSPVLGRFMVPDDASPFDGGGINAYARMNPVNTIDPTGHLASWIGAMIGAVAGMVAVAVTVVSLGGLGPAMAAMQSAVQTGIAAATAAGSALASGAPIFSSLAGAAVTAGATGASAAAATSVTAASMKVLFAGAAAISSATAITVGTTGAALGVAEFALQASGNDEAGDILGLAGLVVGALGMFASGIAVRAGFSATERAVARRVVYAFRNPTHGPIGPAGTDAWGRLRGLVGAAGRGFRQRAVTPPESLGAPHRSGARGAQGYFTPTLSAISVARASLPYFDPPSRQMSESSEREPRSPRHSGSPESIRKAQSMPLALTWSDEETEV